MPSEMIRELRLAFKRFWGLSWWWKGPSLAVAAIITISAISAIAGGGGDGDKPGAIVGEPTSEATAKPTAKRTANPTPKPTAKATVKSTATPTAKATPEPTAVPTSAPTPKPTSNPTPKPTPVPTPVPTPAGPATRFGSGTKVVGQEIAPGTYRSEGGGFCYWERLSGFGGTFDEIIANGTTSDREIVRIDSTDAGFDSSGCGNWNLGLTPVTSSQTAPFGGGTFAIGIDIAAGTWRAEGGGSCYWERLSGFGHAGVDETIANDFGTTGPIVTIASSDVGFSSHGCGTWTLQ